MTVYEYLKMNECDEDFWDDQFDTCVTICCPDEESTDFYDKYIEEISKRVNVIKTDGTVIAGWSEMIEKNFEKFKAFTKAHWRTDYEDHDDFVYEWIKEIHLYVAGYVPDSFYEVLYGFAKELV